MMCGKEEEPIRELLVKLRHVGTNRWRLKKLLRNVIVAVEGNVNALCEMLGRFRRLHQSTQDAQRRRNISCFNLFLCDDDREKIRNLDQSRFFRAGNELAESNDFPPLQKVPGERFH